MLLLCLKIERNIYDKLRKIEVRISPQGLFSRSSEFRVFLEENGLDADYTYNKAENQLELLQTVLAIFQALINNIELYMKIQTEFTTVSSAYKNLRDRIDELEKRIAE